MKIPYPYPGLRPFERHESRIFFGREQQVDELLVRLKDHYFLAVLGASGSGKSSLVKAGLLPALAKGYMGNVGANWSIAELRPGDQPFARLAEALLEDERFQQAWKPSTMYHRNSKGNNAKDSAFLAASLRRGVRSLHEILKATPLPEGSRLLIVVDQFEEIFRYGNQARDQATAFVGLLLEARSHPDIYVVITMRSDFLGKAAEFQDLPEAINDGLYLTPRLTREQLVDAISKPARLFYGKVEVELTNHLCNEVGNNPDQLPLLQHALMRLWEQDEDKTLTLDDYRKLNGLQGALDGHAEQAWTELDADDQRIAETLFRALSERSHEGQDIRRPAKVKEISGLTKANLEQLTRVVEVFHRPGRNFITVSPSGELTPDATLDISHESLIRQWRRLQSWVVAEAEKAQMLRRLIEAAERYRNNQGELFRGTDLALALRWRDEQQPTVVWAGRYFDLRPPPNLHPDGSGKSDDGFPIPSEGTVSNSLPLASKRGGNGNLYELTMNFLTESALVERRHRFLRWFGTCSAFVALVIFAIVQYQAAQAERERRRPIYRETDFVRIELGEFCMGSRSKDDPPGECTDVPIDPEAEANEKPLHRVEIMKPFLLSRHEVTFEEFDRFAYATGKRLPADSGFGEGLSDAQKKRLPVINVSWRDAAEYAKWLSKRTKRKFRLPTEAEWEYAARAGTLTPRPWDGGIKAACDYANVLDRAHETELKKQFRIDWPGVPCEDDGWATIAPVGSLKPNAFGLYDMLGNVWEWVQDCYHLSYVEGQKKAPADGSAWDEKYCKLRVHRGGDWENSTGRIRSARRDPLKPEGLDYGIGFRLAQDL